MKKLKVGVIGQGRSGHSIHAFTLGAMPNKYTIAVVSDADPARCKDAVKKFGCDSTTNYRDLFKRDDLDLIVNATPSHLHVPVTKEILKAGFNCLCEKPIANRVKDVDDLIALSKKTGQLLAVYQQSRFGPYYRKVREIIDSGVLGRIVQIKVQFGGFCRRYDWQQLQEFNGGALLNTGPHPLDQVLMLFDPKGSMPNVWAKLGNQISYGDAEDYCKMILWDDDKPTIDLEVTYCEAYPLYTYHVSGTRGGLTGTTTELQWKYFDPKKAPKQKLIREPLPERRYCSDPLPWIEKSWKAPEGNMFLQMGQAFYNNLYNALTKGTKLEVTLEQVRRQIAVIEEAHRQNPMKKLKKKGWIKPKTAAKKTAKKSKKSVKKSAKKKTAKRK